MKRKNAHNGKARRVASCLLLLALLSTAAPARAADVEDRVDRLENEIQTLSRAVFKGESVPSGIASGMAQGEGSPNSVANIEIRLTEIETQIQALTGKVEQLTNAQAMMQRAAPPPAAPPAMPPQPSSSGYMTNPAPAPQPNQPGQLGQLTQSPSGAVTASAADPVNEYEQAFGYLRDRQYDQAVSGFTTFLSAHPGSNLAPNAQYWLGESYYAKNDFEKAARTFAESYQKYPKGPKAPDSLLKLAMSLAGMGKKSDACLSLGQLKREYADGSAGPVVARAEQESGTLGCE